MPNRQQRRRAAALARGVKRLAAAQTVPVRRITLGGPVALKAAEAGQPEGRQRFRMELYTGEPLRLEGFDLPIVIDCATLDLSVQQIPALCDHAGVTNAIAGQIDRLSLSANGKPPLVAEGYFTPTDDPEDAGTFVMKKAKAGFQWNASIGADPNSLERIAAGQKVTANGRVYEGPCYLARGSVPREASFVVIGADRHARVMLARRMKGTAMTFDEWLGTMASLFGGDAASLDEAQMAAAKIIYHQQYPDGGGAEEEAAVEPVNADEGADRIVSTGDDAADEEEETVPANAAARRPAIRANGRVARRPAPDPALAHRRSVAAEETRIDEVRRICAAANNPEIETGPANARTRIGIQAHAIQQGWNAETTRREVELAQLRAARPSGPAIISRSHERDCTIQALEGAMILRAGGRLDNPAYQSFEAGAPQSDGKPLIPNWLRAGINTETRQRAMDGAHRYAQMSAVALGAECLRIDGREAPHGHDAMIRAAMSSMSLQSVFTTNINAILLPTYLDAPDTTEGWVREQDVADFRLNERPRLLKGVGLTKLPPGGEADHSTRQDSGESYKIARYANQIVIDEQNFIDDNLGAFADTPVEMGQAAARLRPDLVYAILLANPTLATTARALFNATDGNTASGTFALATLRAAIQAMLAVRENSVNLNLMPTHLIVPTDLFLVAGESVASAELIIAGTAGAVTERGVKNVVSDLNIKVVADGRLTNGVVDPDSNTTYSGSSTTWYIASAMAQTIEVGYRRGTGRAPRVRTWTYDKDGKFGIGWDVSMDIGAKALDWKGFQRRT